MTVCISPPERGGVFIPFMFARVCVTFSLTARMNFSKRWGRSGGLRERGGENFPFMWLAAPWLAQVWLKRVRACCVLVSRVFLFPLLFDGNETKIVRGFFFFERWRKCWRFDIYRSCTIERGRKPTFWCRKLFSAQSPWMQWSSGQHSSRTASLTSVGNSRLLG